MTAITNYLTLRAALADTVNRDDLSADVSAFEGTSIDGMIKRGIDKARIRIQRDLIARGGHRYMETVDATITTTAGVEYVDFPTDFLGQRAFMLTTNPLVVLEFIDPASLWTQYPSPVTGQPQKFTLIGIRRAYLRPVPDSSYSTRLVYYAAIDTLSADTDTNWLIDNHWDLYIAAAMLELSFDLQNDDRIQFWKGEYDQKMNDLMGDDRNVRWAGIPARPTVGVVIA